MVSRWFCVQFSGIAPTPMTITLFFRCNGYGECVSVHISLVVIIMLNTCPIMCDNEKKIFAQLILVIGG